MKRLFFYILMICVFSGLGLSAYRLLNRAGDEPEPPIVARPEEVPAAEPIVEEVEKPAPVAVIPKKEPEKKQVAVAKPPVAPPPKPVVQQPQLTKEEQQQKALDRYWDQMARNFDRQLNQLDREQNPDRRLRLIQAIARYVRVDTLAALDWATTLSDPEEQRAALNAINKNALTGIGARIDSDETGLPIIRKTTILSAVESTGMVEDGDYISGMVQPDGSLVYFKDWPLQKVAQVLRGEAGTEVQLMMERVTPDGVWHSFDVPVQRSLIVMQPDF